MGHSRTVGLAVNEMGAIRALEQRDALACLTSQKGSSSCWSLQLHHQEGHLEDCWSNPGVR